MYAEEFGWTPDQVDAIPLRLEPWIMPIHTAIQADITRRQAEAVEAAKKG